MKKNYIGDKILEDNKNEIGHLDYLYMTWRVKGRTNDF